MKKSTALNRKTSRMIAKNLIILLVLAVIAFIVIWAWFTKGQSATANGINVKSRASGVEVSWDNSDFYYDLTALTDEDVVAGETGLAKNISGTANTPSPLKLVTGNGLKFFEPYLNRRTGTVLENADGSWQGVDIVNGEGKYIDIDLYFRSDAAKDIYLAGDSYVSPKSTTERYSDYGYFSKDYICAASRVAFLNANRDECSFIWAPNSNYELKESQSGYTRVTEVKEAGGGSTGGDMGTVIGFTKQTDDYYLWLPTSYSNDPTTQSSMLEAHKMNFTVYDQVNNTGLYTYTYTITEPNTGANPTIIYYVNKSANSWNSDDISYVDVSASKANNDLNDYNPKVALADTFNLNSTSTQQDRKAPAFYIEGFKTQSIDITIGYNPSNKEVIIIGYSSSGTDTKTYDRAGTGSEKINYYEIESNVNTALVSPEAGTAISSGETLGTAVTFKDSSKNNVTPLSITTTEQFTAKKTGEGAEATYQFVNAKSDKYLYVSSSGKVSLSTSHSDFTLAYVDGFTGPALKSGDYYIVMQNGELKGVTLDNLQTDNFVTVYTGSSYDLDTASSNTEIYKFYNSSSDVKNIQTLNGTTTPKLFATGSNTEATVKVGNTKVATLAKENEDSEYYTAHIVIRIWVEGTDRDALTPLADGIFDTSLHFVSG